MYIVVASKDTRKKYVYVDYEDVYWMRAREDASIISFAVATDIVEKAKRIGRNSNGWTIGIEYDVVQIIQKAKAL